MERLVYFTGDVALVDNLGIEECMEIQEPLKKLHDYEIAEEQGLLARVTHGEWIFKNDGAYGKTRTYCSACGKRSGIGGIVTNQLKPYCPNCGAKMDIGEE